MSLIPALGRQKVADLCEFKASLVNRASSKTAQDTQRDPVSENQKGPGTGLVLSFVLNKNTERCFYGDLHVRN